jgi:flagellar basal-body rod protein FlgC
MIHPMGAALSGLKAFARKTAVTAHNVANWNTEGFEKRRALLEEASPSGVRAKIDRVDATAAGSGETRRTSDVDLEGEMGSLITARHGYGANLKTLQTWEEMTEAAIDLLV